ncbi:hypothetical protein [Thermococcus sp.]
MDNLVYPKRRNADGARGSSRTEEAGSGIYYYKNGGEVDFVIVEMVQMIYAKDE